MIRYTDLETNETGKIVLWKDDEKEEYNSDEFLNLLNNYEKDLQMSLEKSIYWRNQANNIWGDMKTNKTLEQENRKLRESTIVLTRIIDWTLQNKCKISNRHFSSRDEFFMFVKENSEGILR